MEPILGNKSFYSRTERMLPVISTIWEIVVINQFNVRPRASPNCTPVRTVGADLLDEEGAEPHCVGPVVAPVRLFLLLLKVFLIFSLKYLPHIQIQYLCMAMLDVMFCFGENQPIFPTE